jgi:hypothetical protein
MHSASSEASLTIEVLADRLSVCRLAADAVAPDWLTRSAGFWSLTRTTDELSVVCATSLLPSTLSPGAQAPALVAREDGWRALKLVGPFAFTEIGVLLRVAGPLADAGISMLPVATFETDYVLVQQPQVAGAIAALRQAGHTVREETPRG